MPETPPDEAQTPASAPSADQAGTEPGAVGAADGAEQGAADATEAGDPSGPEGKPSGTDGLAKRATKSSVWTTLGFGLSQVVRLLSNAVLTRLLPPSMFGLSAIVGVVFQGLEMFSDIGVRTSIVQNKRGEEPNFLNTAWTVTVIRGWILFAISAALAYPAVLFYDEPLMVWLLPVAGLNSVILGFSSTRIYTAVRWLAVGRLTMIELVSQIVAVGVMITWAYISPSVWALVAGGAVNIICKTIGSHVALPGMPNRFCWEPEARKDIFDFGRWIFISTGFSFLAMQGDRLILSALVPMATLGIYSTAAQFSGLAASLSGNLATRVLAPVYARLMDEGGDKLRVGVGKYRAVLMAATLPIPASFAGFGTIIVGIIVGPEFRDAGWMLQLFAASATLDAIQSTIWPVLLASGDSYRYMIQAITRTILLTASLVVGFYLGGVQGLILGMAAGHLIGYPILAVAMRRTGTWLPWLDLAAVAYASFLGWVFWLIGQWMLPFVEPFFST